MMDQDLQRWFEEQGRREKETKLERFRRLNRFARRGQIVFAGSSLMEQFPINELLMDLRLPYTVYNRGVGGFTTGEMADALEECVLALEPAQLFLNIGTNDLNGPDYVEEEMLGRYRDILRRIRERLPQVRLYLLAYYPVNPEVSGEPFMQEVFRFRTNERIKSASQGVRRLAEEFGGEFMDLNAGLLDEKGQLKAEYTIEGMHMYADGYWQVLERLLPKLRGIAETDHKY